jgi:hypothetical protein
VYGVVVTTKSFHAHKRYAVKSMEEEGCKERVGSTLPGITVRRNCDSVFEETFSHHFLATTISGYTHIQQKIVKWQNWFITLLVFYIDYLCHWNILTSVRRRSVPVEQGLALASEDRHKMYTRTSRVKKYVK